MCKANHWVRVSIITLAAALIGCKAAPAPSAGFADASVLKWDPTVPFNKFWLQSGVDLNRYDTIYVAEINTSYMLKLTDWQKGERQWDIENDVHNLAVYTREDLMKAFRDDPNHRFKVVDKPTHDAHTLELEMALIEIVPSKVVLNVLGYAPFFIGTGVTVARSIINDKSFVAFEARVRESGSRQVVMQAADRESEQVAIVNLRGLTWYSDIEGIIDSWSDQFVQIVNKKEGETIADTPTFRLLPW